MLQVRGDRFTGPRRLDFTRINGILYRPKLLELITPEGLPQCTRARGPKPRSRGYSQGRLEAAALGGRQ